MRDLLQYNATHGVLICRECKYAIQKSAVGSHLLRHKIYRGERQRLLSSIARLDLFAPDDVQPPPAASPPVAGLPVLAGYSCTFRGCDRLCASVKRMRRHWSASHGISDPPESFARAASLQTFFRGTKLRYFEVASATSPAPPRPEPAAGHLDLETLRYFHHFTTIASLTLPARNHQSTNQWQTDVIAQALRLRWLMCGLLAISASRLASLSDNEAAAQVHCERAARFRQQFSVGWEEAKRDSGVAQLEEAKTGAQMACIQRCCQWALESPPQNRNRRREPTPFALQSFMATVQGCVDPDFALRSQTDSDVVTEELPIRPESNFEGCSDTELPSNVPLPLLERLRTLPYRMTEAVQKPDSLLDFTATLSAINALVECCSLSYLSDDVEATWRGMEGWLSRLSDHFNQMMWWQSSAAALIVLAHWSVLVERAERHCWFLRGSATKLLLRIEEELSDNSAAKVLVKNVKSSKKL